MLLVLAGRATVVEKGLNHNLLYELPREIMLCVGLCIRCECRKYV